MKDGYIYGRGTIDDKGMLAANLAAIVALKRGGVALDRDVIFLADDDEEQGGDASIKPAIAKYWDKFAAGFALNEEGRVILKEGKVQYVGIQTSEKVPANVTVIATGTSGHASMPRPDNAVVHLAAGDGKDRRLSAPGEPYRDRRALFRSTEQSGARRNREMDARARNGAERLAAKRLSDMSPVWNSMIRDTIAPTMLQAGVRVNVVPSEARANLNVRLLPGDAIQTVISNMTTLVNDPQIRFEMAADPGSPAPPSSLDSPLYHTIEQVSGQVFPGSRGDALHVHWRYGFGATSAAQCAGLWAASLSAYRSRRAAYACG